MKLIICPGIHPTHLTDSFVEQLQLTSDWGLPSESERLSQLSERLLIFPTEKYPAYSPIDIYRWLEKYESSPQNAPPLFFITFSAGVVGGIGAAIAWQLRGGKIEALVAIDGWGVPLLANFPLYRFSHDYFTHWSSACLGKGKEGFYADPSREHLAMWRSPDRCWGWHTIGSGLKTPSTAAECLRALLVRHQRS